MPTEEDVVRQIVRDELEKNRRYLRVDGGNRLDEDIDFNRQEVKGLRFHNMTSTERRALFDVKIGMVVSETDTGDALIYIADNSGIRGWRSIVSSDFLLEVAKGNVPGHSSDNKFGRNIEVDSGVTADVWDGGHTVASGGTSLIWLAPTAARIHTIASTSANDDTGGTGANSVKINYLPDWDTGEATETVTGDLNAGIAMSNAAVMINRMEVIIQSTSTTINAGEITATAATDSTVTARIRIGQGQTQTAIYGIPSTQKLKIGRFYANVNKAGGAAGLLDVTMLANTAPDTNTTEFITKHTFGLQTVGTSAFTIPYYVPKKIDGPAIVKVQVASNTNDMDVSAGFDFVVVDN